MKNIYVGNLDFRAEEKEIRSLLEIYGVVERVTLVRDRDTGQPRGFAFVEMRNDTEAQNAIGGIDGTTVNGRTLNVSEAQPRPGRVGSGERGDRRGGGKS